MIASFQCIKVDTEME